ncbi:unnamed protein product [Prunus armeniaca]
MGLCYMILPLLLSMLLQINTAEEYKTYIIHMNNSHKPASFLTHESWHRSILKSLPSPQADQDDSEMLMYSYNHVMPGFSTRLTPSQLSELEKSPAHVATHPESFGQLYTTRSPKFLGLKHKLGLWPAASYGEGVIIGVIDSGIWPESESFSDKGMPQVPERWKGKCENGTAFTSSLCNKKLIGAQSFSKGLEAAGQHISEYDYDSPRDSHSKRAHVAMYKVLWSEDTIFSASSDVLARMDQAIADCVDIISLSIGLQRLPYYDDVIAIASLSAIEKGIVVVCSAGNDGNSNSMNNGAPWITTVGAATLDRSLTASMTLDNNLTVEGTSYFPVSAYITDKPLYYGKENVKKATCDFGALDPKEVDGKVVLCDNTTEFDVGQQKEHVEKAGAFAGIFMTNLSTMVPEEFNIPAMVLSFDTGALIREHVTKVSATQVKSLTFVHTKFGAKPAPQVAHFSSRGLDQINPSILKPEIIAPGVDVLAAFPPNKKYIFSVKNYDLATDYALMSGTSMAAPHVAGVAALLKAVHREWSPAAIRSAIMTTAYTDDNTHTTIKDQRSSLPATPLDFGAGHINPNKAMDPGLTYDMDVQDYIEFLCGLGYNAKQMRAVIRRRRL